MSRSATRPSATLTGLAALSSALILSGALARAADSAPTGEQLKSPAHELAKGVQHGSKQLAQGIQKSAHESGRELRDAQRQFNATVHRFGRAMREWWSRMRTQLAPKAHSSRPHRGPTQRTA